MFNSASGQIKVDVVKNIAYTTFPAADFSLVNCPGDVMVAKDLFTNLFNTPVSRHIMLVFVRHTREDKVKALMNLAQAELAGWQLLDPVSIWYERPSGPSNIGLLSVCEDAYIFYKGQVPNIKNTSWFAPESPNATNHWGVTPAEHEGKSHTYFRRFSWEISLLLATMSQPAETKKLIYGLDGDHESVVKFCTEYGMSAQMYAKNAEEAKKITRFGA